VDVLDREGEYIFFLCFTGDNELRILRKSFGKTILSHPRVAFIYHFIANRVKLFVQNSSMQDPSALFFEDEKSFQKFIGQSKGIRDEVIEL
jgi:hypothetical protein